MLTATLPEALRVTGGEDYSKISPCRANVCVRRRRADQDLSGASDLLVWFATSGSLSSSRRGPLRFRE